MKPGPAWLRDEEPGLAEKAGERLREEAARARVQIGATGTLPVDQEAARQEITEEERARRDSRPNSRRWRALNKLDDGIDGLRQRQADAGARLTAAEERLKRAPEDDAAILAAWLEAGEKGERPAASVYERERDRDAARLLVAGLERKVDAALERRLSHLERHRAKMLRDAREDVDAARDRLLELVAQLPEARAELLAARDVLLWIAHYPDLPEAFGFPTAIALGLRAPVEQTLQTSSRVGFGGAVAALEADADALAGRYAEETQRRLGTAPPRTPTREAMWTDDSDYQAWAKQERERAIELAKQGHDPDQLAREVRG